MARDALLPCRHCGCGDHNKIQDSQYSNGPFGADALPWFCFTCDACGYTSEAFRSQAEAIAAWNRRIERPAHADAALAEAVKRLQAMAESWWAKGAKFQKLIDSKPDDTILRWTINTEALSAAAAQLELWILKDLTQALAAFATRAPERERAAAWRSYAPGIALDDGLYIVTNELGEVCPADLTGGYWIIQNKVGHADWTYGRAITAYQPLPLPPAAEREDGGHG